MKILVIVCMLMGSIATTLNAQSNQKWSVGLTASGSAVADELVVGGKLWGSFSPIQWHNGQFYAGGAFFYGAFPNHNPRLNQYLRGTTDLIHPLQVLAGHQFHFWEQRLWVRTEMSVGPARYSQRITHKDARYGIEESYRYSFWALTGHSRLGVGVKPGKHVLLEAHVNLPVIDWHMALAGGGVGVAYQW